jgi:hypothetical protein
MVQQKDDLIARQAQRLSQLRQRIAHLESSRRELALLQAALIELLSEEPGPSTTVPAIYPLP